MRDDQSTDVILIAPSTLASRIVRDATKSIRYFESVDEFDRWRRQSQGDAMLFEGVVHQALDEICGSAPLPVQLQLSFEWLSKQSSVPSLKALAISAGSRRSFFRKWSQTLPVSPCQFLNHVARLYAVALLRSGVPVRDVLRRSALKSLPFEHGTAFGALAPSSRCR
jgi:hypothetical protein